MKIEFYRSLSDRTPVIDFINSLSPKAQAKIARSLDLLEEFGLSLGAPHIKRITGAESLWELRVKLSSDSYRILFFRWDGRKAVFLHGFAKKTDKVARRHIEIAKVRMEDFITRGKR